MPAPKEWRSLSFHAATGSTAMLVRPSLLMVVAQHGIFFVFGGRAEGDVHAQAHGQIVVDFVCAVNVGCDRGFGDFAVFRTLDGKPGKVGGGICFIMNAGQHDVGVDGNLAAVEFGQAGGIVEDGRRVGGICRALRVDRLCAEVVAGCVDRCGGKGSAEQQDGFFSVKGVISVSVKRRTVDK